MLGESDLGHPAPRRLLNVLLDIARRILAELRTDPAVGAVVMKMNVIVTHAG